MKLNLKERKGITLIALVITIIVLLILAGVSIAMLTGQNGILTQANNAKDETEQANAKEKVESAVIATMSQSKRGTLDADKLVTEITNHYGGTATKTGTGFPVNTTVDGKSFTIDGDGNVTSKEDSNQPTPNPTDKISKNTSYVGYYADIEPDGKVDGGAFPVTVTIDGKSFTVDSDGNVTSKDSETAGKVTIIEGDGKSVGNIIAVTSTKETTEKFYVLSYDESTQKAKALAEWNLKVGNIYNNSSSTAIATDSDGYGLQNKEMKGYVSSGQPYNGVLPFSNSWYFKDTFANYPVDKDGMPYVYDSNSNLYTYVNKYKELLGNTDKVSEVSLASYADINALWSNKSKYPWLCNTSFWLGSAYASSFGIVWNVNTDGAFSTDPYSNYDDYSGDNVYRYGVRPVITIDMSEI